MGLLLIIGRASAQTSPQNQPSASTQDATSPGKNGTIKVNVEMVLVRVVVHDHQGKPVENLHQEDFRLFDNGKQQEISQFDVEALRQSVQPVKATGTHPIGPDTPALVQTNASSPPRFLALYFDDFSMKPADVDYARAAADRYLAKNLRSIDRAAIVTASGAVTVEFTTDVTQLHKALFKLMPSSFGRNPDCPKITDYQAEEIVNRESDDVLPGPGALPVDMPATQLAIDEAINRCHIPSAAAGDLLQYVRSLAQKVLDRSQMLARYRLEALNRLVNYISLMPGQRNIVLVSSGFLTTAQQLGATSIIDGALRSQVIISSIDAKGVAVQLREADASQDYVPAQGNLVGEQHQLDSDQQIADAQILQEIAESTGGKYFHNNNDRDAGFREAAVVAEPGYVLAFSSKEMKFDGKFHSLKVTLHDVPRGYTLQARKGYFAPLHPPQPDADVKQQIQDALHLRMDLTGLPVALRPKTEASAAGPELLVWAHLDIHELHFRKDGENNVNSLTFVSAIFSRQVNFVTAQEKQLQRDLPEVSLEQLKASGIDVTLKFPLKAGAYVVREVVTDSEEHRLTALSRDVEVSELAKDSVTRPQAH